MSSHEERINGIRDYLRTWRMLRDRSDPPPRGLDRLIEQDDYILENGEAFQGNPKPRGYRYGARKACFQNAAQLAFDDPSLMYYEGYAVGKVAGFPIHHAWCVDEDGRVVDTTWRLRYGDEPKADPRDWSYLGVGFHADFVARVVSEKDTWGVLDSPLVYEST